MSLPTPSYSEYPTSLPAHFPIGAHQPTPLLSVTELQAHLRLLGAFHKLKEDVQSQVEGIAATNKELGWVIFVNRAVCRFFAWTAATWNKSSPTLSETYIPPLDVIMVWHTYLLNPRAFFEDAHRMSTTYCTNLIAIEEMPLILISSLIDPQTLDPLPPSEKRQFFFEQVSQMSYHMPMVTDYSDILTLNCPFCAHLNQSVRWVADGESGFAQTKFSHTCEQCGESFNKSNIGVRRFCEEVTRRRTGERVFISETLLHPLSGIKSEAHSIEIMTKLFGWMEAMYQVNQPIPPESNFDAEVTKLALALGYDYLELADAFQRAVRPFLVPDRSIMAPRIQRISVAYSHAGLASLDLVGAVLRQGAFIEKMVELEWTQPGRFDLVSETAPLVRSVARYHAFLDLMAANPRWFFDIDLVWHTHQLKSWHYRDDTYKYLRCFPNHDDSVESPLLSKGYDLTAKAWKDRFGVPYSVCGCIPDTDPESRLSRFTSKITSIGGSSSKKTSPSSEGISNPRPDLVTTEIDEADATHPSEHNQQFGDPNSKEALQTAKKREKQSTKCVSTAKKSASRDPWKGLQAERNEKRDGHKEAFTDPNYGSGTYYPYWGVSVAVPVG
ncbi:hypothetical protein FRC20_002851 [Serendipita sp. 405]|nr:hypothetical protein FRC15_002898 [Serendipita sp. 397]KAG8846888.1 hypothetical protein FRC20_002851 [Serendipita sp. 405]